MFDDLDPSSIVLMDGSHYSFMGSDVTPFFLEVMRRIKPGTFVHLHDICLPSDYAEAWNDRY
jgi:hypothetical protein